ncbi:MAG: glutamine synthetase, partial [Actinomycetota bacterium]|nr:glutamine synthetase [Actinomycetota bacterium]
MILKNVLAQAQAQRLELFAGAEIEYFLVRRGDDGTLAPADVKDTEARPCYDARG